MRRQQIRIYMKVVDNLYTLSFAMSQSRDKTGRFQSRGMSKKTQQGQANSFPSTCDIIIQQFQPITLLVHEIKFLYKVSSYNNNNIVIIIDFSN